MSGVFKNKFVVTPNYIPSPSKRRSGLAIAKVRFLVAHDTGNPKSTASQNVRYYINSKNEMSASAHLFVDDKEIIECVPALTAAPEKAWHVLYGVPKDNELFGVNANDAAIGVEYCYGGTIDADKAYEKYVWTLAKLCFEFQLDPAKDIVGHFFLDPKRKTDPVTGLAHSRRTYEQLLRDIVQEYNDCTETATVPVPVSITPQTGKVTVAVKLNIRKEPNTRASIVQVLSPGAIIDFVAVAENGQPVNNNPVWYKDINGNYFWSGGVKPA
ncbi:MAG TPA: peptidoglycan recognition family protein [Chitinophagaceae bacterium]